MSKSCTDDYRALDVRKVKSAGRLTPGSACSWSWSRNGNTIASINLQADDDDNTNKFAEQARKMLETGQSRTDAATP